jgi:hypothetical protein
LPRDKKGKEDLLILRTAISVDSSEPMRGGFPFFLVRGHDLKRIAHGDYMMIGNDVTIF